MFLILLQEINLQKLMPGSDLCIDIKLPFVWIYICRCVFLQTPIFIDIYIYMHIYGVYVLCIFVAKLGMYVCVCFLTLESPMDAYYHLVKINHWFLHWRKRNKHNILVPYTGCSRYVSICWDCVKNYCFFIWMAGSYGIVTMDVCLLCKLEF